MARGSDREELYRRCDLRFDRMIADGALDEARTIYALGLDATLPAMRAVGLPHLVATSLEDYEARALKFARDPFLLTVCKRYLLDNRTTLPLFDTARFTRHIEAAYTTMWETWQRGEAPQAFAVAPIG